MKLTMLWVAAVLVAVAGCGGTSPGDDPTPAPPPPSTESPTATAPTGTTPTGTTPTGTTPTGASLTVPPLPPKPSTGGGEVVVEGVVSAGVEAGCLVLETGNETYLLLGADPAIAAPGQRVIVSGKPDPGVATTCMQGTPFAVREVKRG
ncbi:hypothetical protein KIPE111705_36225 [Kibdelosporangium persicum]|uniref:hypothetical protein n=1 Tax=Kibdelosporangium persicum TaxID=2698649 RepID=UPI0015633C9B|nr:hypothetical protein [Kibdelosporangium persicum]